MTYSKTRDVKSTLEQINRLYFAGADLVRCAVFNKEDITGLCEIKKQSPLPIIADIHFNFTYAVAVADFVDAIRINPGNIGGKAHIKAVAIAFLSVSRRLLRSCASLNFCFRDFFRV